MRSTVLVIGVLFLVLFSAACGVKDVDQQKLRISANDSMDAETLAQAAEQLVAPHTFMLADKVLDMSLTKDPQNPRALFYKNMLKGPMVFKGILTRISPYIAKYGDVNQFNSWQNQIPNSAARDFLFDGAPDLKTTTDVQNLLVQYRQGVEEFRKYLKQNTNTKLTLNLSATLFQGTIKDDVSDYCVLKENTPGNLVVECDYRQILQREVNSADMIALSQIVAGQVLYVTMYSNYAADGVAELLAKESQSGQLTAAAQQAFLESFPGWGKLRNDHNLGSLTEFGADLSAAWKYMVANQGTLCPAGDPVNPKRKIRKGYLFDTGLCTDRVGNEAQQLLAVLDVALQGVAPIALKTPNHGVRLFQVDAFHSAKDPIKDLRTIGAASYSACGKVTSFRDKTLGGIFPSGDADLLLDQSCQ